MASVRAGRPSFRKLPGSVVANAAAKPTGAAPAPGWKARGPNAKQRQAQEAFRAREAAAAEAAIAKDVWSRVEPMTVKGADGHTWAITFSNDSEIGYPDAFRTVLEDPAALAELEKHFEPKPVTEWTKDLKLSEKQFRQFGLRKGVDRNQAVYRATDLGPASFEKALTGGKAYKEVISYRKGDETLATTINNLLPTLIEPVLKKKNYPVSVVRENLGGAEIRHQSSEPSPKAYADYMRRLHHDFKTANSHLHIGLPSAGVSEEQGMAIAMALETRTLLALAAASDFPGAPLSVNYGSVLMRSDDRGPVRYAAHRFEEPYEAHDVELRQWNSIEHGMSLIASAAEMAQSGRVWTYVAGRTFGTGVVDPYIGNIGGALEHAGVTLARHIDPTKQKASRELLRLAKAVQKQQGEANGFDGFERKAISQALRTKIYKFLSANDVDAMLDTSAFLMTASPSAPVGG